MPVLQTVVLSIADTLAWLHHAFREVPRALRAVAAPQFHNMRHATPGIPRAGARYKRTGR